MSASEFVAIRIFRCRGAFITHFLPADLTILCRATNCLLCNPLGHLLRELLLDRNANGSSARLIGRLDLRHASKRKEAVCKGTFVSTGSNESPRITETGFASARSAQGYIEGIGAPDPTRLPWLWSTDPPRWIHDLRFRLQGPARLLTKSFSGDRNEIPKELGRRSCISNKLRTPRLF